ncbi:hypothetical protein CTI14_72280, partial [Methylobacterium radiotolerans]
SSASSGPRKWAEVDLAEGQLAADAQGDAGASRFSISSASSGPRKWAEVDLAEGQLAADAQGDAGASR